MNGIRDLAEQYDVFMLDMWGVLHDGHHPFPGVLEVIRKLRSEGKTLIVLSNSSKRREDSVRLLTKLGFSSDDFTQIITSGEVAWNMLTGEFRDEWFVKNLDNPSKKVCVLGSGDGDAEYCQSCGWIIVPVEKASLILARGTYTVDNGTAVVRKEDDAILYEQAIENCLSQAAKRNLPMLVTNPDKVRPDKDLSHMPGMLGDKYEQVLRNVGLEAPKTLVKRIGKPLQDFYHLALQNKVDKSRAIMVGDALETDVLGASLVGIDTAWVVLDGIHGPDVANENELIVSCSSILNSFNARSNETYACGVKLSPTYVVPHFKW